MIILFLAFAGALVIGFILGFIACAAVETVGEGGE